MMSCEPVSEDDVQRCVLLSWKRVIVNLHKAGELHMDVSVSCGLKSLMTWTGVAPDS